MKIIVVILIIATIWLLPGIIHDTVRNWFEFFIVGIPSVVWMGLLSAIFVNAYFRKGKV